MAEIAIMGYLVDRVEGAYWADGADRGDATYGADVAEMSIRMNALFYFDCLGHKELKNIAFDEVRRFMLWSDGWDGQTDYAP